MGGRIMPKRLLPWSCASLLLAVLTNCGGGSPDLFPLGPCAEDPCVHGSCVPEPASGTDSFTCECDEGWAGGGRASGARSRTKTMAREGRAGAEVAREAAEVARAAPLEAPGGPWTVPRAPEATPATA